MNATDGPEKKIHWPLWGLLVFCGSISLTLSVIHAFDKVKDGDNSGAIVALLTGIAPVIAAAMLSHLVADPYSTMALKIGVGIVFLGAMTLSVKAQAETVRPIVGEDLDIVFPLVLDLSTIVALLALAGVGYSYQAEARKAELRAELLPSVRAELQAEFREQFTVRERELRAELERNKDTELATRERELRTELDGKYGEELAAQEQEIREELITRVRAAEEEIRRQAETEIEQRVRDAVVAAEARVRLEITRAGGGSKRPTKEIEASKKGAGDQANGGLSKRDRAESILRTDPEISVKDLAGMLGCTTKYARNLIHELVPGRGNGQEETPEGEVHLRAVP
ncbi:hypothetical protein [Sphaerimonospora mesophila]|uniref:hypothetical protein n=1 Tax=Sphaerimonospora mesophila TaxID=37483 RepID=UPI0006E16D7D